MTKCMSIYVWMIFIIIGGVSRISCCKFPVYTHTHTHTHTPDGSFVASRFCKTGTEPTGSCIHTEREKMALFFH